MKTLQQITELRNAANLSQNKLQGITGVTRQTIASYEKGESDPLETPNKVLNALGYKLAIVPITREMDTQNT